MVTKQFSVDVLTQHASEDTSHVLVDDADDHNDGAIENHVCKAIATTIPYHKYIHAFLEIDERIHGVRGSKNLFPGEGE